MHIALIRLELLGRLLLVLDARNAIFRSYDFLIALIELGSCRLELVVGVCFLCRGDRGFACFDPLECLL